MYNASYATLVFRLYVFSTNTNFSSKQKILFRLFFSKEKSSVAYTTEIRKGMAKVSWKLDINILMEGGTF